MCLHLQAVLASNLLHHIAPVYQRFKPAPYIRSFIAKDSRYHTSLTVKMPQSFIVTLDDHASEEDLQSAKDTARNQGGKITNEYTIIKGFSVEFPDGTVHALDSIPCVKNVEADQIVTTQ